VFAAFFPPIHGAGAGLFPSANGPDMGTVHNKTVEIDFVGVPQVRQQHPVDLVPNTGGLPVAQAMPTGHATTAPHLLG